MDKVVPLTSGVPRRGLALGAFSSLLNPSPTAGGQRLTAVLPRARLDSLDSEQEAASQGTHCILVTIWSDPGPLGHHPGSGGGVADKLI